MIERTGDDCPSPDDIDYYGFYYACQRTNGNFALFDNDKKIAARGRFEICPLFWSSLNKVFSFVSTEECPEEFPTGHLYNGEKLVCWDAVYFDKPCSNYAPIVLMKTFVKCIQELDTKVDAMLFHTDDGSMLVSKFSTKHAYSALNTRSDYVMSEKAGKDHTLIFCGNLECLAKYFYENTSHKKFICGAGLNELFSPRPDFRRFTRLGEIFAKYGLEIYSPFLDNRLASYVLDMTLPEERQKILRTLVDREIFDESNSKE
jgi:hypothetical protein